MRLFSSRLPRCAGALLHQVLFDRHDDQAVGASGSRMAGRDVLDRNRREADASSRFQEQDRYNAAIIMPH
jgi:hypothetical protein